MMRKNELQLTFRSSARPSDDLPLSVRSVGLYGVSNAWSEVPRKKDFLQVFHIIRGALEFKHGKGDFPVSEGESFQYLPGDVHHVRVMDSWCHYFWITLDHPGAAAWLSDLGLASRRLKVGPYREGLYERIASALKNCTPEGDRMAAGEVFQMFLQFQARGRQHSPGSLAGRAKDIMNRSFPDPNLGVAVVAEQLDVHRTTLMRAFKSEFGLSPCQYLQDIRIQHALARLKETIHPIQEIAAEAGFVDPNYFARLIRQKTGFSPGAFRNT